MPHYQKPPLVISDQIEKLKQRGLFPDGLTEAECQRVSAYLSTIGFYRLSAYFIPFEDKTNTEIQHAFLPGTTFDQILSLYVFDRQLRLLILEALERIEVAVRTGWTNALTTSTCDSHAYMKPEHFKNPHEHLKHLNRLASEVQDSKETFVTSYRKKYAEPFLPPTWAVVETLSFGGLSLWYSNTRDNHVKKQVSDRFGIPTVELMDGVLEALTVLRNVCAHHARCWNREYVKRVPYLKRLRQALVINEVDSSHTDYLQSLEKKLGRLKGITVADQLLEAIRSGAVAPHAQTVIQVDNHLYNYLVVIIHMMIAIQPTTSWPTRLTREVLSLQPHQQRAMGFPENWQTMPFWQDAVAAASSNAQEQQP